MYPAEGIEHIKEGTSARRSPWHRCAPLPTLVCTIPQAPLVPLERSRRRACEQPAILRSPSRSWEERLNPLGPAPSMLGRGRTSGCPLPILQCARAPPPCFLDTVHCSTLGTMSCVRTCSIARFDMISFSWPGCISKDIISISSTWPVFFSQEPPPIHTEAHFLFGSQPDRQARAP